MIIISFIFLLSSFQFIWIVLCFGVIPSSRINDCLNSTIGSEGGADFGFDDENSNFYCNGKQAGYFLKGYLLNHNITFCFFIFLLFSFEG
jgi:hypothetical protein